MIPATSLNIHRTTYISMYDFLIEAKVSRCFDEMVAIVLEEVDFDDPTTNVRGRRVLAIAKPTPRGY